MDPRECCLGGIGLSCGRRLLYRSEQVSLEASAPPVTAAARGRARQEVAARDGYRPRIFLIGRRWAAEIEPRGLVHVFPLQQHAPWACWVSVSPAYGIVRDWCGPRGVLAWAPAAFPSRRCPPWDLARTSDPERRLDEATPRACGGERCFYDPYRARPQPTRLTDYPRGAVRWLQPPPQPSLASTGHIIAVPTVPPPRA